MKSDLELALLRAETRLLLEKLHIQEEILSVCDLAIMSLDDLQKLRDHLRDVLRTMGGKL